MSRNLIQWKLLSLTNTGSVTMRTDTDRNSKAVGFDRNVNLVEREADQ